MELTAEQLAQNMGKILQALRHLAENPSAATSREVDQLEAAFKLNTTTTTTTTTATTARKKEESQGDETTTMEAAKLLKDLRHSLQERHTELGVAGADTGDKDRDHLEALGQSLQKYASILKTPKQRRIQTLVVSMFIFFTAVPFCLLVTCLLLFWPVTMPFILAHLIYIIAVPLKHPLPRRRWLVKSFLWKFYRDFFPVRLLVSSEVQAAIDPTRNYLFCYHPHGIHSFGALVNFGSEANEVSDKFPGLTFHLQTLGINFYIPFFRYLAIFQGAGDASAKCLKKTLTSGPGQSAVLVVGGAKEAALSAPKTNNLVLDDRKGFIKIALTTGSSLVPVYGFGETNVYETLGDSYPALDRFLQKMRRILRLSFTLPLFAGRGYFNYTSGVLPHRRPIITVVGKPIDLPKIQNPTQQDIDKWHATYKAALMELYEENKGVYDSMAKSTLKIVH